MIALIARADFTPAVRAKVDAILATDTDALTAPDMASRATLADAWRAAGHRETAHWHFVDTELDHPNIDAACFGHPAPDDPASAGPSQDCVVNKVREFEDELAAPATPPAERLLALKYLLYSSATCTSRCIHRTTTTGAAIACWSAWAGPGRSTSTLIRIRSSCRRSGAIRRPSPRRSGCGSRPHSARDGPKAT